MSLMLLSRTTDWGSRAVFVLPLNQAREITILSLWAKAS